MSDNQQKSFFADKIWPSLRHFVAGSASGIALVLAGHPFDTIKVRLQTEQTGRFKGPIHCLMVTLRTEGMRGLYKGATPPMIATGFINSLLFGMMGMCKQTKAQWSGRTTPTIGDVMFCGVTTGFAISVVVTPIELVKARLQVQYAGEKLYSGPFDVVAKLIQRHGLRGLYIGWFPTVLHRGSNWAYFGGYEISKRYLTPPDKEGKMSFFASVTSGAVAGTSFWLSCYPIDVIKNRMQTAPDGSPPKYKGFLDCTKTIYRVEGWRAFFKGFTPCLMRSVPANAAAFTAFELAMSVLPK